MSLPPEVRNLIYEDVARQTKAIKVLDANTALPLPTPLHAVSRQVRQEYTGIYNATALSYARRADIVCTDFCMWELLLSLQSIPAAAPGISRKVTFCVRITRSLLAQHVVAYVKETAHSVPQSPANAVSPSYKLRLGKAPREINHCRLIFAHLARKYRFHHPEAEQRVFENLYWAFAEAAEKIDGVSVREYGLGCWKRADGGMSFV